MININRIIISLFLITLFNNNVFAQDTEKEEKVPLFEDLQDRTFRLNQQFSDNPIYSPFNSPFAQSRFVPDIAFIMDFSYVYRNIKNSEKNSFIIPGFNNHNVHNHGFVNEKNGFNLNYGELALSSSIDPFFDMFTNFHLSEYEFEIEELFFNTRSLPWNLQVKAGKFLSSFGRINQQHHHFWDFSDQPIIYRELLGSHGILEKGMQLNWLVPTDFYLLLGAEALMGENEKSFGVSGFSSGNNLLEEVNHPNLLVTFIKSSFDIDNLVILTGASFATGGTRIASENETTNQADMHIHAENNIKPSFAGASQIYGLDLTLRYFLDSYNFISFQTEFLHRNMQGSNYIDNNRISYSSIQSGLYSQLIYRFSQQWRIGIRYDQILANSVLNINETLNRYTAMIDFNPSEFSRLRLQFNHDRSNFLNNNLIPVNELILQLNMAMGAHGAHQF